MGLSLGLQWASNFKTYFTNKAHYYFLYYFFLTLKLEKKRFEPVNKNSIFTTIRFIIPINYIYILKKIISYTDDGGFRFYQQN